MLHWKVTNQILVAERKYRANTSLLRHVYKAATFFRQNLRHKASESGHFSRLVVSQLLLAQIDVTNRKPKPRFLLGLGEPFEPNPWNISDSEDDGKDFLMASQMVKSRSHCCQICEGPLNRLLNLICFVKTASQRARRCKRSLSVQGKQVWINTHTRTGMHR